MEAPWLGDLNEQQRAAVTFGQGPLLVVAGAGTGKTRTLAYRVAYLIASGIQPSRILLLTFTRRAAAQMLRRVAGLLGSAHGNRAVGSAVWGGTFHAIAHRLLRLCARSIGLSDRFTVIDRSDAEDLLNTVRSDLGLDATGMRFPRKSTCMDIYSRCVNARQSVEQALAFHFPWCGAFPEQLKRLFRAYTDRKQRQDVLDFDDLLLYWRQMMEEEVLAEQVRSRFDAVLVDEYKDTNALQAEILQRLCPGGRGLTAVGDDAQSIYSFRAATIHNILHFPSTFPAATVLKLEHNYRSVQPILDAANAVIALSSRGYRKELFCDRTSRQKPRLVTCLDEQSQSDYVIGQILQHYEEGIPLHRQAVLFRAAHHSDALELELSRRNIPFVKYGGLKFLEAAHVKDVLAILRLAENPRDATSAFRVLQMLDGFGPAHARRAIEHLAAHQYALGSWLTFIPPAAASEQWPQFTSLLLVLSSAGSGHDAENAASSLPDQIAAVRRFYVPILERRYDQAQIRKRDLEQLEQISAGFSSRAALLVDLTLDPPHSTQDLAGAPFREEDCLILSTIHSAKGCEWDAVYIIHAADGNIPADMACGSEEEIEEERRLLYVAMTRARDFLEIICPLRYYHRKWPSGDRHSLAQLTRFLPDSILDRFERVTADSHVEPPVAPAGTARVDLRSRISALWA